MLNPNGLSFTLCHFMNKRKRDGEEEREREEWRGRATEREKEEVILRKDISYVKT